MDSLIFNISFIYYFIIIYGRYLELIACNILLVMNAKNDESCIKYLNLFQEIGNINFKFLFFKLHGTCNIK